MMHEIEMKFASDNHCLFNGFLMTVKQLNSLPLENHLITINYRNINEEFDFFKGGGEGLPRSKGSPGRVRGTLFINLNYYKRTHENVPFQISAKKHHK